jgi:hypothetical protein
LEGTHRKIPHVAHPTLYSDVLTMSTVRTSSTATVAIDQIEKRVVSRLQLVAVIYEMLATAMVSDCHKFPIDVLDG